ncbi:MAG: glutathione S-transferase family protein [Oceanospirillaceae bacterium]
MNDIIFHHYPPSPVAEKVRVVLGIKQLSWNSVTIPRVPPKPLLTPLTGGFRRTPVMQIGADVYCDSQCILRELEKRYPEPTAYSSSVNGVIWGVSRWTDNTMFELCLKIVLTVAAPGMPKDLLEDRARLYFGPNWDFDKMREELAHLIAQLRAHLGWIEQQLSTGEKFLLGENASLADALAYYLIWFIRGRWVEGPEFLKQFPAIIEWEQRVSTIGHGTAINMSAEMALSIAKSVEPTTPELVASNDPLKLELGMDISIVPDENSGEQPVYGKLHFADRETIGLTQTNDQVGTICINFPRVGYRITVL